MKTACPFSPTSLQKPKSDPESVLDSSRRNTENREGDLRRENRGKGRRRWVCGLPQERQGPGTRQRCSLTCLEPGHVPLRPLDDKAPA